MNLIENASEGEEDAVMRRELDQKREKQDKFDRYKLYPLLYSLPYSNQTLSARCRSVNSSGTLQMPS
jgi:hypothetical protein